MVIRVIFYLKGHLIRITDFEKGHAVQSKSVVTYLEVVTQDKAVCEEQEASLSEERWGARDDQE